MKAIDYIVTVGRYDIGNRTRYPHDKRMKHRFSDWLRRGGPNSTRTTHPPLMRKTGSRLEDTLF